MPEGVWIHINVFPPILQIGVYFVTFLLLLRKTKSFRKWGLTLKSLTLEVPETKKVAFANSVNLDEVAHNEPPHLDLHCLPSSL